METPNLPNARYKPEDIVTLVTVGKTQEPCLIVLNGFRFRIIRVDSTNPFHRMYGETVYEVVPADPIVMNAPWFIAEGWFDAS